MQLNIKDELNNAIFLWYIVDLLKQQDDKRNLQHAHYINELLGNKHMIWWGEAVYIPLIGSKNGNSGTDAN